MTLDVQTTAQEEETARRAVGQRRVNILWELTQATIAIGVAAGTIYAALWSIESPLLANAFFLVIGFYFGRTNHQREGGVGGPLYGR